MPKFPTVAKVVENKFGQVVEIMCLFGFVEAMEFRDSSQYLNYVQNV